MANGTRWIKRFKGTQSVNLGRLLAKLEEVKGRVLRDGIDYTGLMTLSTQVAGVEEESGLKEDAINHYAMGLDWKNAARLADELGYESKASFYKCLARIQGSINKSWGRQNE